MKYLSNDEFFKKYYELEKKVTSNIYKFEVLQNYFEYDIEDWSSITPYEMKEKILECKKSILKNKTEINSLERKKLNFKRIRYIKFPITKYILRQFSAHTLSSSLGDEVVILEGKNIIENFDQNFFKDFLLFDDLSILVHDYNEKGYLKGAWFSEDKNKIKPFIEVKNKAEELSIPINDFCDCYNMSFHQNTT